MYDSLTLRAERSEEALFEVEDFSVSGNIPRLRTGSEMLPARRQMIEGSDQDIIRLTLHITEQMKKRLLLYCLLSLVLLWGCAGEVSRVRTDLPPSSKVIPLTETGKGEFPKPYEVNGERYYPLPDAEGFIESGKASWYGPQFHGRRTSSGEIFDMYKKTAAHKTLPLQTLVRVTNLSNGKHIILPINDRGPFIRGRIIDLSYTAAQEIDLIEPGTADVSVVALGRQVGTIQGTDGKKAVVEAQDFRVGEFTVQVGAFENRINASRLAERLRVLIKEVNVTTYIDHRNRTLHRVQVSLSRTLDEAKDMEKRLQEMGFKDAFVLRI